jgi:hypothetical protein
MGLVSITWRMFYPSPGSLPIQLVILAVPLHSGLITLLEGLAALAVSADQFDIPWS